VKVEIDPVVLEAAIEAFDRAYRWACVSHTHEQAADLAIVGEFLDVIREQKEAQEPADLDMEPEGERR